MLLVVSEDGLRCFELLAEQQELSVDVLVVVISLGFCTFQLSLWPLPSSCDDGSGHNDSWNGQNA